MNRQDFPLADKLLILCDAGGSSGYQPRLWKHQVQELLADQLRLEVTVCHYSTRLVTPYTHIGYSSVLLGKKRDAIFIKAFSAKAGIFPTLVSTRLTSTR